jgi:hypothetical protein
VQPGGTGGLGRRLVTGCPLQPQSGNRPREAFGGRPYSRIPALFISSDSNKLSVKVKSNTNPKRRNTGALQTDRAFRITRNEM